MFSVSFYLFLINFWAKTNSGFWYMATLIMPRTPQIEVKSKVCILKSIYLKYTKLLVSCVH